MDWSVVSAHARTVGLLALALALLVLLVVLRLRARRALPYRCRTTLLSSAERNLFVALRDAAGPDAQVWPRVGAPEVLDVRPGTPRGRQREARRRLAGSHFDFVLCAATDTRPLVAVQCGPRARDRRERRLERACRAAGLALLRLPRQDDYDADALRTELEPHLEAAAPGSEAEGGLPGRQEPIIDLPPD